jgi:hypothetical protein
MTEQDVPEDASGPQSEMEALGVTVAVKARQMALEEISRLLPYLQTKPGIEEAIANRYAELEEMYPPDELTSRHGGG